ncbi:MAG TPA: hypothetical protein VGG85_14140 [Terracidiphilus sp.]|jgi:hypothetical protein
MKSDRLVIGSVVFLAAGLGLIFYFCHGSTAFNLAYPVSGTSIHFDITTTGVPALVGVPMAGAGALLLVIALIAAIVSQSRAPEPERDTSDRRTRRAQPFEETEPFED